MHAGLNLSEVPHISAGITWFWITVWRTHGHTSYRPINASMPIGRTTNRRDAAFVIWVCHWCKCAVQGDPCPQVRQQSWKDWRLWVQILSKNTLYNVTVCTYTCVSKLNVNTIILIYSKYISVHNKLKKYEKLRILNIFQIYTCIYISWTKNSWKLTELLKGYNVLKLQDNAILSHDNVIISQDNMTISWGNATVIARLWWGNTIIIMYWKIMS